MQCITAFFRSVTFGCCSAFAGRWRILKVRGGYLPFFASPKKGKPKKGDRRLALRVLTLRFSTICAGQKMGRVLNSLRSNNGLFFPIFRTSQIAKSPAEIQSQKQRQNQHRYRFDFVGQVKPAPRNGRLAVRVAPALQC
jgi:hypothetical protein